MAITNSISSLIPIIRMLSKDSLQDDGRDLILYSGDKHFPLSERRIKIDSIIVSQNGMVLDDSDWSYDSQTNRIFINFVTSGMVLNTNDVILITYDYYKKFRDDEIQLALSSGLAYFAMFKYGKLFQVISSSDNDLGTIEGFYGLNPTPSELYFIAIVTSIVLAPQHVNIVTPEFRLSAARTTKSDIEQIASAFAQFKRFTGTADFESYYIRWIV